MQRGAGPHAPSVTRAAPIPDDQTPCTVRTAPHPIDSLRERDNLAPTPEGDRR
jgi:hypothetical protein